MPECTVKTVSAKPFVYVARTATMAEIGAAMGESFQAVAAAFAKAGAAMEGPAYAHYTAYDDNSATFEAGFSAHPEDVEALRATGIAVGETVGGEVMTAMHIGPYDTLMQTYDAIGRELASKGLTGTTDMWECYLSPPETPPEQTQTEVLWPIAPNG